MLTRRARTITRMKEIENVMWPSSMARKPSPTEVKRVLNTRSSADPRTSSGVTSGNSEMPLATLLVRERQRVRPRARAVPMGTAMSVVSTPSSRLLRSDRSSSGLSATEAP